MVRRLAGAISATTRALALALAVVGCGSQEAPLVSTSPGLQPAFSRDVPDYAVRCDGRTPLTLDVRERDGLKVDRRDGQRIPLREGQGFAFAVRDGNRTTTHHVRCLPRDFPRYEASVAGERQAEFHLLTMTGKDVGDHVAIFDSHGVPVWWYRSSFRPWDPHLLPNGNLAFAPLTVNYGKDPKAAYEERTLTGELVRRWKTVGGPTDSHEFLPLENGNALMITYVRRDGVNLSPWGGDREAHVFDGEVQEIRPDGTLAWRWRARDAIEIAESVRWFKADKIATGWDLHHLNAAAPDGDGGILVSSRYTDAIYRIDRRTGDVDWKLGGYETPDSLDAGDPGILGGQHDVRVLPDGTITIYDNANSRGHPPRALRLRVDREARTAEVLEKIEDPEVRGDSHCCGSADRLPGGNWVIGWGGTPIVTETRPDGTRTFRLAFEGRSTYRVEPILPGVLERETLREAMDAQLR